MSGPLPLVGAFAAGLGGTLALALGLIASQRPVPDLRAAPGEGLDFSGRGGREEFAPLGTYMARDGTALGLRRYPSGRVDCPLLVMVHGSGWHGLQFDALAARIATAELADVAVPDLRGHGPLTERPGDVGYVGQLEDDLADLIGATARPGQAVVMLGHSSGGGLVIRFAGGRHGALAQGAILLAPYLKYNAPTARKDAGGWVRVLTRRMIGLSILNALHIRLLNRLTVIQFRFPPDVLDGPLGASATRGYSWRMNTSFGPRGNYLGDIARLPSFLLIAGAQDEAFVAEAYEPTLSAVTDKGRYLLVPEAGHLGIVDHPRTYAAIAAWLVQMK